MNMTIKNLADAIEAYPEKLGAAMADVQKAEDKIEKLEDQIADEEALLDGPAEETPASEDSGLDLEMQIMEQDRLMMEIELECKRIEGKVELDYRRNPPAGDKVTEATVSAVIKSDPDIFLTKQKYIAAKFKKEELQLSRRTASREARLQRPAFTPDPTSPKLEKLREKLETARAELAGAEYRVEVVKASIGSYQLLVQLYTSGLLKERL